MAVAVFDGLDVRQTILVVDDSPDNLALMAGLLKSRYRVRLASSGDRALRWAQDEGPPDLILLDILMPGMSGSELCVILKSDPATAHIPVIFLTSMSTPEDETRGLELGAVDFITKPVNPPVVLARVEAQLKLKRAADFLRDQASFLEEEVVRRTQEVRAIQDVTILAMASLAETRDNETGNHIRRTQIYIRRLAEQLRSNPRYEAMLTDAYIATLYKSAPLHDIGKIGIPDKILLKPGKFEPHEFEIMKKHCQLGRDAIQQAEDRLGLKVEFLTVAKEIAYGHQEKWDGSGYPQGLAGEAIPLSARLMAVADVYDALISRRVYREGMPIEVAEQMIIDGKGQHFDPDIIDAFVAIAGEFREIADRYAESSAAEQGKEAGLSAVSGA